MFVNVARWVFPQLWGRNRKEGDQWRRSTATPNTIHTQHTESRGTIDFMNREGHTFGCNLSNSPFGVDRPGHLRSCLMLLPADQVEARYIDNRIESNVMCSEQKKSEPVSNPTALSQFARTLTHEKRKRRRRVEREGGRRQRPSNTKKRRCFANLTCLPSHALNV